jgi:hypothetical protein
MTNWVPTDFEKEWLYNTISDNKDGTYKAKLCLVEGTCVEGRIYKRDLIERELERLNKNPIIVENGSVVRGSETTDELWKNRLLSVDHGRQCGVLSDLRIEDNIVYGTFETRGYFGKVAKHWLKNALSHNRFRPRLMVWDPDTSKVDGVIRHIITWDFLSASVYGGSLGVKAPKGLRLPMQNLERVL